MMSLRTITNTKKFNVRKSKELLDACKAGDEGKVERLCCEGEVDVNFKDKDGLTLFHHAIISKHPAIITRLIESCKVDVNARDKKVRRRYIWLHGTCR